MNWQPIETFPKPTKEYDIDYPHFLFFSKKTGVVIGRCYLTDEEEQTYRFSYDSNEYNIEPTYWMPLPPPPLSNQ